MEDKFDRVFVVRGNNELNYMERRVFHMFASEIPFGEGTLVEQNVSRTPIVILSKTQHWDSFLTQLRVNTHWQCGTRNGYHPCMMLLTSALCMLSSGLVVHAW